MYVRPHATASAQCVLHAWPALPAIQSPNETLRSVAKEQQVELQELLQLNQVT